MSTLTSFHCAVAAAAAFAASPSNNAVTAGGEATTKPILSNIEKAQRAYLGNNLSGALALLDPWLKAHPSDAVGHYLKANCLLKSNRNAEASYEYARAEQLAPTSKIAEYCRAAQSRLSTMHGSTFKDKTSADDDSEEASDANELNENKGLPNTRTPIGKSAKPVAVQTKQNSTLPPGTLELIRKQAEMARRRALVDGAAEADNERLKATNEARSLQEKAERLAGRSRNGNEPVTLSPEEKDRLRSQSAASSELLKEIGDLKAAQAEEGSRYKAEEIRRQSEHLQEQLLDDRIGGSKLNPVGTNLYIRNYSKPPVAAMRAQIRSLSKSTNATMSSSQTSIKFNNTTPASPSTSIQGERSTSVLGNGRAESLVRGKVLEK